MPIMRPPLLAASLVLGSVLLGACGADREPAVFESTAETVSTRAHNAGDGYLDSEKPDVILARIQDAAEHAGGEVLAGSIEQRNPLRGHVDVRFIAKGGEFQSDTVECFRFGFEQPPNDQYVREITHDVIKCPPVQT
jgi:hypothetical protein